MNRPVIRRSAAALIAAFAAAGLLAQPAAAAPAASELVKAELIAEPPSITPGEPFWVGVRLVMKEKWHTYWRNPGDSGLPTEIKWSLPAGYSAGAIVWPTPSLIRVGPLANFGYEGETVLLTRITPPRDVAAGSTAKLAADVSYLVCERECIPGEARVSRDLPVGGGVSSPPNKRFEAARAALPQPSPWPARLAATAEAVTLYLDAPGLRPETIRTATFFPQSESLIDHAAPQALDIGGDTMRLTLRRSALAKETPTTVEGVLVLEEDVGGSVVKQAFAFGAPEGSAASSGFRSTASPSIPLLTAIALALLGGVLLNLMPCVFPVLSVKVLHLVQHAGEGPARMRLHGVAYMGGVLASFAALAGVLYALRAGGAEVGWGYQLQSPLVVAALAYLLFAMALSLSGVLAFGNSLTRVGGSLAQRAGLQGSFFTGVLATVVATPCTAPFMGVAIGAALTQSPMTGISIFLALGFGLGLPFLLLAFAPGLQRLLPRPGAWMETLKQFMAFPLYATVAWLIWVLSQQVGSAGLFASLIGLVLIGFGAWVLQAAHSASGWRARLGYATAAVAMLALAAPAYTIAKDGPAPGPSSASASRPGGAESEPFTQARLDVLLASDRPVFVNMTAAWCITCLVNERTSLSTAAVREAFAAKNVAYLKGDWTARNPEITRMLERFGRSGVPLYLLYGPGKEPVVLPQILTESALLEQAARL